MAEDNKGSDKLHACYYQVKVKYCKSLKNCGDI